MSDSPAAPPPMKLPEVPAAVPLATQLENAIKAMPEPKPKGMRALKEKKAPVVAENNETEVKPSEINESEVKPEDSATKEPVTQEKLSHGFAKLMRQQKAAEREDARIKAELEKLSGAKAEHEKTVAGLKAELDKRQADIDELFKLMDEDADKFVDALARRKNLKKDDIYDRWTRQRLNGGVPAPEDQISRSNGETEKLKKELEELRTSLKTKEEETSKKSEEEKKRAEYEAAVYAENTGFLKHIRDTGKYPLLAKEADQDIIAVGRKVANGSPVTYEQLAAYLEEQLSFQQWREAQKAETPKQESAPTSEGKKTESKKTLTNKMASTQTTQAPSTRRNEHERIEELIERVWK